MNSSHSTSGLEMQKGGPVPSAMPLRLSPSGLMAMLLKSKFLFPAIIRKVFIYLWLLSQLSSGGWMGRKWYWKGDLNVL